MPLSLFCVSDLGLRTQNAADVAGSEGTSLRGTHPAQLQTKELLPQRALEEPKSYCYR